MTKFYRQLNFSFQLFFLGGLFLFFSACLPLTAHASSDHNVRGYARLSGGLNDGTYISFNCFDDAGGGRFPFNFPIHFSVGACEVSDHGVNIASNGNFSGSAWHYIIGEIDFETSSSTPTATPDESWRSNCAKDSGGTPFCTQAAGCSACFVRGPGGTPGSIYGYARVDSLASSSNPAEKNGWIKLNGITVYSYDALNPAGDWQGTISAVNTPASIGAIRFNCDNGAGNNICNDEPDYPDWKTYIWSLWVKEMTAPNLTYKNACDHGALKTTLKWYLSSGVQRKWELIVNNSNSTSSPLLQTSDYGNANSFPCAEDNCHLNYNTPYYWWIKLWYSVEATDPESSWIATPWVQFDHSSTGMGSIEAGRTDTPNDYSFMTYQNEFPYIFGVSAVPLPIIVGTSTELAVSASYYTPSSPATPTNCTSPYCKYYWISSDWGAIFNPNDTTNQATTSGIFSQATNTSVTVKVTDQSGYYCSSTYYSDANFGLPLWKEVKVKKDATQ